MEFVGVLLPLGPVLAGVVAFKPSGGKGRTCLFRWAGMVMLNLDCSHVQAPPVPVQGFYDLAVIMGQVRPGLHNGAMLVSQADKTSAAFSSVTDITSPV